MRNLQLPVTPDGTEYLAMAAGRPAPLPFAARPLIPLLAGQVGSLVGWLALAVLSTAGSVAAVMATARALGFSWGQAASAGSATLLHPWLGVWWLRVPVLVDPAAAFLMAVGCWACAAGVAGHKSIPAG